MSDEPTIRDLLHALQGVGQRLDAKIDAVGCDLMRRMSDVERRLKNEIAGAYGLHDQRISDLERRLGPPPTH